MKKNRRSIFTPLFKTIDKVIFGIEEPQEMENQPEMKEWIKDKSSEEDQEDRVAVRSTN